MSDYTVRVFHRGSSYSFSFYGEAFDCLRNTISSCNQDQRVAIGKNVLSVVQGIMGNDWCDLELQEFICSALQVDPTTVCSVEEANKCIKYSVATAFSAPEQKCL